MYGFSGFIEEFFHKYPGDHFISPLRLSGSAIETLFSQFKHASGGKLSAVNYETARATHLVKHTVVSWFGLQKCIILHTTGSTRKKEVQ